MIVSTHIVEQARVCLSALHIEIFDMIMKMNYKVLGVIVTAGYFTLVSGLDIDPATLVTGRLESVNKRIVCYFGSWSGLDVKKYVDPNICTHIIYAFVSFDENGQIVENDASKCIFVECVSNYFDHELSAFVNIYNI